MGNEPTAKTRRERFPKTLWFASVAIILAIVAVGSIVSRDSQHHVGSPIVVHLTAAVIITAFAAVANIAGGRRAAAAVVGVLIAIVVLIQPA